MIARLVFGFLRYPDIIKDAKYFEEFIEQSHLADASKSADVNKHRISVMLYLSKTIAEHKIVLADAANAINKYSNRLSCATWALVLATIGLCIVTYFMAK